MQYRLALTTVLLTLSACNSSLESAAKSARAGRIDYTASIRDSQSIMISAPADRIWTILSRVDRWPTWRKEVGTTRIHGPFAPGFSFTWDSDGTAIESQIALAQPNTKAAWTGSAFGLTAIHVWTIRPMPTGETLVQTAESMRGFPASLFYSSSALHAANARWLSELKKAAERR